MIYDLLVSPEAEKDISDAFGWFEDHSKGLGSDFLLCVDAGVETISRTPLIYQIVYKNIRRCLIKRFPYGIYYIYDNDKVIVVGVLHASRNPKLWQKRS